MLGKTLLWILKEGRTGADDWEELHIEPPIKTNGRLFWSSGIYESCGSQKSSGIWAAKRWQCQCSLVASTSTLSSRWRTIIIIRSSVWQNGNEYQWLHSVHLRVSGSTLLYKLSNSSWSLPYLTFSWQFHPLSFCFCHLCSMTLLWLLVSFLGQIKPSVRWKFYPWFSELFFSPIFRRFPALIFIILGKS